MGEVMKILWHVNIALPDATNHLGLRAPIYGGWLSGLLKNITKRADVELVICFFHEHSYDAFMIDKVTYYAVNRKKVSIEHYRRIISTEKPDLIHVFGTEFPEVNLLIKAFQSPHKTIIQMQGLVHYIGESYTYGIPKPIQYRHTLRDFIKHDTIISQKHVFLKRSPIEANMIKHSHYVIGRTTFDESYVTHLNPTIHYERINEILRDIFYEKSWSIDKMNRHQIMISQAHYPIKGFHLIIPYLGLLAKKYPDLKIVVTGKKPFDDHSFFSRLFISSYELFLRQLIHQHKLQDHIHFTGEISEKEMCDYMIESHVFLSSSVIENESNSLSEALSLGLPAVSSSVGGIPSRIKHGHNGLMYSLEESIKIVDLISSIFDSDQYALILSKHAKEDAKLLFNPAKNSQKVIDLYYLVDQSSS